MHVVLSTVPVNLRHSAPFLSVHDLKLPQDKREQWRESTHRGAQSADQGNWNDAIANFQAAMEIDPGHADTHFRLATALEHAGRFQEAKAHYERALDLDALRFRADTRINQTIRRIAARMGNDGLSFVDSAAAAEQASTPYQPGWNLLLEHVHYDFPGTNLIAGEVSRSIVKDLTGKDAYQPLATAEVARRVGFPNFDTIEEIRNLQRMIRRPPFPGQGNYVELQRFLDDKVQSVIREVGSSTTVLQRRREVTDAGLADWKVHFELAVLNQRIGNTPAMYHHLNKILELYPHNRETYMKIAEALSKDGKWREAIPYLEQSLYYTRGDETKIAETTGWLGTAHLRIGEYEKATELLLEVTEEYPDQIALTLKAYGNLIKDSRERGQTRELERYVAAAQGYAKSLVRSGKDKEFPMLYQRMSQLMGMAGHDEEAKEWSEAKAK
jgi:tetratricopeptide (TPR) repeat protein